MCNLRPMNQLNQMSHSSQVPTPESLLAVAGAASGRPAGQGAADRKLQRVQIKNRLERLLNY